MGRDQLPDSGPLLPQFLDDRPDWPLHCDELQKLGLVTNDCCGSCHDDWNEGFNQPIEYEHDGKIWAYVCCSISVDMDDLGYQVYLRL